LTIWNLSISSIPIINFPLSIDVKRPG